ncbi:MAG: hypothetical protein MUE68_13390 [Bacteroidetes bacterium]|nr:hypothetical protein [Bacteroidota bacterium]
MARILFPLLLLFFASCRKEQPTQLPPLIDPVLLGGWYSRDNFVGFEVLEDGTTKNLVLDNGSGVIRYPLPSDPAARLNLTLLGASDGLLQARVVYVLSSTRDTTALIEGLYALSSDRDSLFMTIPDYQGNSTEMDFQKAVVGAVLVP